jgi:hypothetical protein
MKSGLLTILVVVFSALQVAKAQTNYTSKANGNWHTGTTWNGNAVPTEWAGPKNNVTVNHNITGTTNGAIYGLGNVTLATGKSFTSTGNLTLSNITNFVSNGTITINGDLTIPATSLTINSGTLVVTGKLTVTYGSTLTIKSGASFSAASMEVTSNSDAIVNLYGTGHITQNMAMNGVFNVFLGGFLDVDKDVTSTGGAGRFNITGEVNIDRDFTMSSGPGVGTPMMTITPTGKLTVGRDFAINGGTSATIDGSIAVTRDIKLGDTSGGSQINGVGTASWGRNFQMTNNGSTVNGHDYTNPPTSSPFDLGSYSAVVLPIKLAAFTVAKSGQDILVKWTTSMEENFEYFSVQRSTNGVDFEEIAQINGKGWSEVLNDYDYTDTSAPAGRLYYRLQSFDFDGYTEIFKVLSIEKSRFATSSFSAYPNPLSGAELTLSEGSVSTEAVAINIFDQSGVLVKTVELAPFQNTIDLNDLHAGVYILKSSTSGEVFRLIKK